MSSFFWKAHNNKTKRWGIAIGATALEAYRDIRDKLEARDLTAEKDAGTYEIDAFNLVQQ